MTLREFADMFALLAVQLRQTDADEALIRGYYEGLQDLEPELLKAAADRLSRAAEWFPKTSDWRTAAEAIRRERIDAQRAHLRKAPRPVCCVCDDTGWQPADVVENGRALRRVTPCACRALRRHELLDTCRHLRCPRRPSLPILVLGHLKDCEQRWRLPPSRCHAHAVLRWSRLISRRRLRPIPSLRPSSPAGSARRCLRAVRTYDVGQAGRPSNELLCAHHAYLEHVTSDQPVTQTGVNNGTVPAESLWLTLSDVTVRVRCGRKVIYRAVAAGKLRAATINARGDLRFRPEWVNA